MSEPPNIEMTNKLKDVHEKIINDDGIPGLATQASALFVKKTICDVANPPPIFPHHPDPLMAHRIILSFCIPFVLIIEPGKLY